MAQASTLLISPGWSFYYFNNIAIAVKNLFLKRKINRAQIIDIDLHYGDGTVDAFTGINNVSYYHLQRKNSLNQLEKQLATAKGYDILAVSAGFDRHVDDWGGILRTEDYLAIGNLIKIYAERHCSGRRFAVLEGGYNHKVLGKNVKAFIEGMK